VNAPKADISRLNDFPVALRALIEAEIAAGNEIVEIASCHPAPPVGAYAKLARAVSTRARASGDGLDFYDRNSSLYSGEFTDSKRFFFVLEPPHPPEPEPDMDAIRARLSSAATPISIHPGEAPIDPTSRRAATRSFLTESAVERFERSMIIDYEKWHDGIGYDLEVIRAAKPQERVAIESLLLSRGVNDWRDVEALAEFDTARARDALRKAMKSGNHRIRAAVMSHAPELVPAEERLASLVKALKHADFYGGLTEALDAAEELHPPVVMEVLFRGALSRSGEVAVHFAAMLMFLHGKAKAAFDWEHRPFYLRFNTPNREAREAVFRELCEKIGVDAAKFM
jgi:hypothetical protein